MERLLPIFNLDITIKFCVNNSPHVEFALSYSSSEFQLNSHGDRLLLLAVVKCMESEFEGLYVQVGMLVNKVASMYKI